MINSHTKHYWNTFDKKVKQFNKPRQLPEYLKSLIGDKKKVKIADIASGPVNTLGDSWPGVEVDIECSDVFAKEYKLMWCEKELTPLTPIKYEDIINLSYSENTFDIVHCRNALDHIEDPLRAVEELKRVSKKSVILLHAPDQMVRYGGHHTWNIRAEDGLTAFYGKEYSFILDGFNSYFDGELIVSIWKK